MNHSGPERSRWSKEFPFDLLFVQRERDFGAAIPPKGWDPAPGKA
jgi:hypothetical protein